MWVHALGRAAPVYQLNFNVYTLPQQHTSGFRAQGIIHISSVIIEEVEERARGRRPMRSCGRMRGKVNGNRQRDIRTNRTCLENGSVELVMMRRLRIELMYNSTWFLPSKVTAR